MKRAPDTVVFFQHDLVTERSAVLEKNLATVTHSDDVDVVECFRRGILGAADQPADPCTRSARGAGVSEHQSLRAGFAEALCRYHTIELNALVASTINATTHRESDMAVWDYTERIRALALTTRPIGWVGFNENLG